MLRAEIAAAIGTVLVLLGLVRPSLLTRPAAAWWRLAHVLGYINTRILLTLLYFFLLTPMGLIWRAIGKDPMARQRASWPGWTRYPQRYRDPKHYERMY